MSQEQQRRSMQPAIAFRKVLSTITTVPNRTDPWAQSCMYPREAAYRPSDSTSRFRRIAFPFVGWHTHKHLFSNPHARFSGGWGVRSHFDLNAFLGIFARQCSPLLFSKAAGFCAGGALVGPQARSGLLR